ncbi:MAG TPA: PEP-CTERM sorting domain-containing protein [Gammaproteobacteria bacterium]|nr:PEP-CTERM sorting domain-containing protein [Gammaproteobacteria bacterium]
MGNLNLKLTGIVAAAALLLVPVANAQISLLLDDGNGNTASMTDVGNTGMVNLNTALGDWTANVTTGIGAPLLGSSYMDEFDLNSVNVSGGTGTMTVMMTQTDLSKVDANWWTAVGGTTDGNITFESYVDDSNNAFGLTTLVTSDMFNTGAFSSEDNGSLSGFGLTGLYSWTIVATIVHGDGNNVSSFDYNVKIPEPSSLALLGLGLLGAGFAARRKANKAA